MNSKKKILLAMGVLLPIFVYVLVKYFTLPNNVSTLNTAVELTIPRGTSLKTFADSLEKKGLVRSASYFVFWAKKYGLERKLPSGKFRIPGSLNTVQLVKYLLRARPEFVSVTLIEGWSTEKIFQKLSTALKLNIRVLDSLGRDSSFLASFGIPIADVTGYLLPDTYVFAYGISEKQIVRFLIRKTLAVFEPDSIRQRMKVLGLNRHQILTLASIVEGEALLDRERPIIASVYLNRLKRGMRLQADPTIQFLIKDGPRRLRYRDLKIRSPYNTYLHAGLPPGPINNPGKKSIMAVLFAAKTKYLYFVAKGDGSHFFARTAAEHAKAKQKLNRLRRKIYGY